MPTDKEIIQVILNTIKNYYHDLGDSCVSLIISHKKPLKHFFSKKKGKCDIKKN